MKRNIAKRREIKPKKRQVVHNAIAHHPLTDARAAICLSRQTPSTVYILGMMFYGMEYPLG